jgi:hypothetical protein
MPKQSVKRERVVSSSSSEDENEQQSSSNKEISLSDQNSPPTSTSYLPVENRHSPNARKSALSSCKVKLEQAVQMQEDVKPPLDELVLQACKKALKKFN